MTKLNQIIAIEKGAKGRVQSAVTQAYHQFQKTALFTGLARTYRPKDDEGDQLPPENTKVQLTVDGVLADVRKQLVDLFDVTATKEWANTQAKADVIVGGQVLLKDVPVTYLLFLEKQLVDIHTLVSKLPTLDPTETWTLDPNANAYATAPKQTIKTKKVMAKFEKAPATDKHPAQVEVFHEDVTVGYWTTITLSGAWPAARVAEVLERIERLQRAVKIAREEANSTVVQDQPIGAKVFQYLFD